MIEVPAPCILEELPFTFLDASIMLEMDIRKMIYAYFGKEGERRLVKKGHNIVVKFLQAPCNFWVFPIYFIIHVNIFSSYAA